MGVSDKDIDKIINFVKKEPRTVQEISKLIKRSWVTTDKYLKQIKEKTGVIDIKTFRKGSQAALKVVYYSAIDLKSDDEIKNRLYLKITNSNYEQDFDFLDLFQFVPDDKKKTYMESYEKRVLQKDERLISLIKQTKNHLYIFSGNLTFLNVSDGKKDVYALFEDLLKRGVFIKIILRINIASISNISRIKTLITKYPNLIEVRHSYHPLRGIIVDDAIARFKNEEYVSKYKEGELTKDTRIYCEIYDAEWIEWLEKLFWNMFNSSITYENRIKEIEAIFK